MLPLSVPARQQAHDLVDRLTPVQLSALIDLFEPLTRTEPFTRTRTPFFDELPVDTDMTPIRALHRNIGVREA